MTKRMTVVFHDEELYAYLKVEAAKRQKAASEIIAEAVREWRERQEGLESLPIVERPSAQRQEKDGRSRDQVAQASEETVTGLDSHAESKSGWVRGLADC